jgi:hypothetical protein
MVSEHIFVEMLNNSKLYGITGFVVVAIMIVYTIFSKTLKRPLGKIQFSALLSVISAFLVITYLSVHQNSDSSPTLSYERISEEKTQQFLRHLEAVIAAKDIDGLIGLIASDASIFIESEKGIRKAFSRADYKSFANNAFTIPSSFKMDRVSDSIQITDNGKRAIVTTLTIEHATIGTFESDVLSSQVTTIEMRDGVPAITSVIAKTVSNKIYRKNNGSNNNYVAIK